MQSASTTAPGCSTRAQELNWPCPSHIDVYVRNLHLLNLDKRSDWPGITAKSFLGSQQNLRPRIAAVEWSLYHLFLTWNPEVTQNKLRPFFPPLDQLQSVNLRGALFRALSELKKDGVLGREIIMRKSMFDDCKGEKFEEMLASFSTVVLQTALSKKTKGISHTPTPIMAVATGEDQHRSDCTLPLVIALRVSMDTVARERAQLDHLSKRATEFLKGQEETICARLESCSGRTMKKADPEFRKAKNDLTQSWTANPQWVEELLDSDVHSSSSHLLNLKFSEAWPLLRKGKLDEVQPERISSLTRGLEDRLNHQQSRLQKWKSFQQTLSREKPASHSTKNRNRSKQHVFQKHQTLGIVGMSRLPNNSTDKHEKLQKPEHTALIKELNATLLEKESNVSRGSRRGDAMGTPRSNWERRGRSPSSQLVTPSKTSSLRSPRFTDRWSVMYTPSPQGSSYISLPSPGRLPDASYESPMPGLPHTMSPVALSDVVAHHSPVQPSSDWETVDGNSTFAAPTSRPRGNTEGDSNQPHDIPSSPARDKHSHARAQSEEGAEVDIVSPLPFQKHNDPFRVGNELDGATLVERTRRSMSLVPMPAQPPAPEPDQDTVDNSRLAVPTTPFETPRKPRSRSPLASSNENMFGATTPREELFNREADYDSVFKSRPKIAMSPVRQPLAFMPEQSIEDMLADDYDGPSMIAESTMNESPLVKKFR